MSRCVHICLVAGQTEEFQASSVPHQSVLGLSRLPLLTISAMGRGEKVGFPAHPPWKPEFHQQQSPGLCVSHQVHVAIIESIAITRST